MVGVSRSKGCQTCKTSRVKCDEAKPICGRCKRLGRDCVYPSAFKFLYETDKLADRVDAPPTAELPVRPKPGVFFYTSEKMTENGSLFQKWHKSALLGGGPTFGVSLSPSETQGYDLTKCWSEGPKGMRFDLSGQWIRLLPSRLGASKPLDDAVNLLCNVHCRMLEGRKYSDWMCLTSYNKSLRSLQKAVVDPVAGYKIETMAAATILYQVEEMCGDNFYDCIKHAGGIGLLLEQRGKLKFETELDWNLVAQNQTAIVTSSVVNGTPCFLSEPSWIQYLESYEARGEFTAFIKEMLVALLCWPTLVSRIRQLRSGMLSFDELVQMRSMLIQIKSKLDELEAVIDKTIAGNSGIRKTPAKLAGSPLDQVLEFDNGSPWAGCITAHCSYSFIVENMADVVDRQCVRLDLCLEPIAERQTLPYKFQRLVSKVCRVHEWASFLKPVLAGMLILPLITAYEFADTCELRAWILRCLEDSQGHRPSHQNWCTPRTLKVLNEMYTGARDMYDRGEREDGEAQQSDTDSTNAS